MSEINFKKLAEPFPAKDIEWRLQSCGETNGKIWGKVLAYVTNRAIQQRLDDVCGPENWKNEYTKGPDGGILCGISIRYNGEFITKWDGAENTQVEAVKGGLSDSMKRAAVQWSMGRYLYNLKDNWAVVSEKGIYSGKTKENKWFKWNPPKLPAWAVPDGDVAEEVVPNPADENPIDNTNVQTLINTVLDYIAAGTLTGEVAEKANTHIRNKDETNLKKVIDWCKDHSK